MYVIVFYLSKQYYLLLIALSWMYFLQHYRCYCLSAINNNLAPTLFAKDNLRRIAEFRII